jgi:hypothetical protein
MRTRKGTRFVVVVYLWNGLWGRMAGDGSNAMVYWAFLSLLAERVDSPSPSNFNKLGCQTVLTAVFVSKGLSGAVSNLAVAGPACALV